MTPLIQEWTIVLVGSWNLAILNPDWFARRVFDEQNVEVELLLQNFVPNIRFHRGPVAVIPSQDRVTFGIKEPNTGAVVQAEIAAKRLLAELPVTPIQAIGLNYAFKEANLTPDITASFEISDAAALAANDVYVEATTIVRQFLIDTWRVSLTRVFDANGVTFRINYHHDVATTEQARELLEGVSLNFLDRFRSLLREVYGTEE